MIKVAIAALLAVAAVRRRPALPSRRWIPVLLAVAVYVLACSAAVIF